MITFLDRNTSCQELRAWRKFLISSYSLGSMKPLVVRLSLFKPSKVCIEVNLACDLTLLDLVVIRIPRWLSVFGTVLCHCIALQLFSRGVAPCRRHLPVLGYSWLPSNFLSYESKQISQSTWCTSLCKDTSY
jgi:hypothetical protein